VFPQFSNRGPLANHGFARTSAWQVQHRERGPRGEALAVLRLVDDARTRSVWPHAFVLELGVRVSGDTLTLELTCTNTGAAQMPFTCALHSYLRVADVAHVALQGLHGQSYWDKTDGLEKVQDAEVLVIDGEVDRVYAGVQRDLLLRQAPGANGGALRVGQRGFDDVVVWNPGPQRCAMLPDMPAQGYRQMLCVEAARIAEPVSLLAGARWQGMQQLRLAS
jgi:glucose-6-phosphate 1-epimerase